MCGGTHTVTYGACRRGGLSPRVRGNPGRGRPGRERQRSIPACAGEPDRGRVRVSSSRVYPRVCGGTPVVFSEIDAHYGLSPRVRGNLPIAGVGVDVDRSIPACAGEPWLAGLKAYSLWVYPRVCGGTDSPEPTCRSSYGLSPRVRGNRSKRGHPECGQRSIPACAGEP